MFPDFGNFTLTFHEMGRLGQSAPEEMRTSLILVTMKMQPQEHGDVDSELDSGFQAFDDDDDDDNDDDDDVTEPSSDGVNFSFRSTIRLGQVGKLQDWYSTGWP